MLEIHQLPENCVKMVNLCSLIEDELFENFDKFSYGTEKNKQILMLVCVSQYLIFGGKLLHLSLPT